jgi:hypothetical protein
MVAPHRCEGCVGVHSEDFDFFEWDEWCGLRKNDAKVEAAVQRSIERKKGKEIAELDNAEGVTEEFEFIEQWKLSYVLRSKSGFEERFTVDPTKAQQKPVTAKDTNEEVRNRYICKNPRCEEVEYNILRQRVINHSKIHLAPEDGLWEDHATQIKKTVQEQDAPGSPIFG